MAARTRTSQLPAKVVPFDHKLCQRLTEHVIQVMLKAVHGSSDELYAAVLGNMRASLDEQIRMLTEAHGARWVKRHVHTVPK